MTTRKIKAAAIVMIPATLTVAASIFAPEAAAATSPAVTQDSLGPLTGQPGRIYETLKVHSGTCFTAQAITIAVRNMAGNNLDLPAQYNKQICPSGYTYTGTKTLTSGSYTIFGTYKAGGVWHNLPSKTLTLGAGYQTPTPSPSPSPTPSPTPSRTPTPSPTQPASPIPNGPGGNWQLKFADEFDGLSVDVAKWSFKSTAEADQSSNPVGTGNPNNQQMEFDQPGNCTVSGGFLDMVAKPDSITSQSGKHYGWSSCMINSSPSYAFQYGYIEERAKLPNLKGFWPAFWTWAKPGVSIPGNGETDGYEVYTDNQHSVYQTQHNTGGGGGAFSYNLASGVGSGYHVYGVDIEPEGTTWYVDGVRTFSTPTTSHGLTNILSTNFVYDGNGDPSLQPTPGSVGHKSVDYIRAYQH